MSITENINRIGYFTSSQIYRLMGTPAPRKTYIEEVQLERQLKVSINDASNSRAANWGSILEHYVAKHYLPIGWEAWTEGTIVHPLIQGYSGTPDIGSQYGSGDIKCFGRKKFAQIANLAAGNEIANLKAKFPEIYWQITSNAILTRSNKCLLVSFLPYDSELEHIRNWVANYEIAEEWKYRFIVESDKAELPHQSDNSDFENVIVWEWDLVIEDADNLLEMIKECLK